MKETRMYNHQRKRKDKKKEKGVIISTLFTETKAHALNTSIGLNVGQNCIW